MPSPFRVISVTASLEVGNSNYGNGAKTFSSFKAATPAESPATLDEALAASVDLHLAAFESTYASMVAQGIITVEQYNEVRTLFKRRREKIMAVLAAHPIEP